MTLVIVYSEAGNSVSTTVTAGNSVATTVKLVIVYNTDSEASMVVISVSTMVNSEAGNVSLQSEAGSVSTTVKLVIVSLQQ